MKLSGHAKIKLEIYNISGEDVIKACGNPIYEIYDVTEDAHIKIIELQEVIMAVVITRKHK